MGLRKKKKRIKRTYRAGRVYFCRQCGYYTAVNLYEKGDSHRNMFNPSLSVKAINRTCNDCKVAV